MNTKKLNLKASACLVTAFVLGTFAPHLIGQQPDASAPTQAATPQLEERHPRYELHREDVLTVSFPLTPELNQTVTIQPDGYINLQNAKEAVYAQGLTVPGLIDAIKKAYAGVLHNPIVNVDIQDFQKPMITVNGQVAKPGQYEMRMDLTVSQALAVAGGLMPTAKKQVLLYHRASNDWYEVKKIDMKQIFNGKNVNEDALLQPGDMLFVPETTITVVRKYIPYGVNTGYNVY